MCRLEDELREKDLVLAFVDLPTINGRLIQQGLQKSAYKEPAHFQ